MIAQKNVTHMFIGANAALATTAVPATARYIGIKRTGDLLCNANALTAAAGGFQVVYLDVNGKVQVSPTFDYAKIISKSKIAPVSAAAQVVSVGSNGTSGALVATNSGKYIVTIGYKDGLKQIGNKRLFKYGEYTADTTATQAEIAIGLAANLQKNLERDAYQRIKVKAVCGTVVVAGNAVDGAASVVKGSNYVSITGDGEYAAHTNVVVGDYFRIGGDLMTDATTVVTSDVYKVVEFVTDAATAVFRVDRPIQCATDTYTTTTFEVIPAATGNGADWGLLFVGNDAAKPFELGKFAWDCIRFDVGISPDFGTTPVAVVTKPTKGMGSYKEVAQMEWELQNNRREPYRIAEYPVTFTSNAVSTDVYDYFIDIRFREDSTETIGGTAESYTQLIIACDNTGAGNTLSTALGTVFSV
jgi:hypothetical protein